MGDMTVARRQIDGTYRQTNLPNESAEYLSKREELRLAEIDLMNLRERIATLRRQLPPGAILKDYAFIEGPASLDEGDSPASTVRLSELFTAPESAGDLSNDVRKKQTSPCPMCTSWLDAFNGVAHHLAQSINLAVAVAADLPALRSHARKRGWDKLRLLSAGESTFKYDLGSEDREEARTRRFLSSRSTSKEQCITFTVFIRRLADNIDTRGTDEYNPIWNVLDLTPQGRGTFEASLDYGTKVQFGGEVDGRQNRHVRIATGPELDS